MISLSTLLSSLPSALLMPNGPTDEIAHPAPVDQGAHTYKPPAESDLRSVCPALNTLSNHSHLPHDGRNITFRVLAHALHTGYGISPGFANFLVLGTYMLLKHDPSDPLDLQKIGKHNGVEHDASVVHDNASGAPYAPIQVNLDLLHKFLNKTYIPEHVRASQDSNVFTIEDIAYARIAREATLSAPLDAVHAEIARGEFAMFFNIFGIGPEKTVSRDVMETWIYENRFPAGWAPGHRETLTDTISESASIRKLVDALRDQGKENDHQGVWGHIEKTVEGIMAKM